MEEFKSTLWTSGDWFNELYNRINVFKRKGRRKKEKERIKQIRIKETVGISIEGTSINRRPPTTAMREHMPALRGKKELTTSLRTWQMSSYERAALIAIKMSFFFLKKRKNKFVISYISRATLIKRLNLFPLAVRSWL